MQYPKGVAQCSRCFAQCLRVLHNVLSLLRNVLSVLHNVTGELCNVPGTLHNVMTTVDRRTACKLDGYIVYFIYYIYLFILFSLIIWYGIGRTTKPSIFLLLLFLGFRFYRNFSGSGGR